MTLSDIKQMEIGDLIDFIVDFNGTFTSEDTPKAKKATQADWNAFWG